ncbi:hypothetical protein [Kitasatospora sp. LaBMicrA B282]|uniref:hypothetical protein n=1 Tax=Kitasatospora sp. LaBMicrA B282 TaxID=3420949 RepID=UPI003D09C34A
MRPIVAPAARPEVAMVRARPLPLLPLAVTGLLLGLTACGSTAQVNPGGPMVPGGSPPAAVTLDLSDHADHATVRTTVGATVRVTLHSTYWSAASSSAPDVLAPSGSPTSVPSPGCVPGAGCGTVSTAFTARAAGTAVLTATRTTCGEALACAPDQRTYTVTVTVTAPTG